MKGLWVTLHQFLKVGDIVTVNKPGYPEVSVKVLARDIRPSTAPRYYVALVRVYGREAA